jgi:NADH-quinone oxidoreductase subunit N
MEMVVNLATNAGLFWAMLPEIVLAVWALALMLVTGWRHHGEEDQRLAGHLALAALVSALFALWWLWAKDARPDGIAQMVTLDGFRYASSTIFLLGAIMAVMLSLGYVGRERILTPEYYLLILFATIGMMVMSAAADLIVLFIGLEIMSVCVYVLAGINRRSVFGAEAALKYFLLGAFASGFVVYGIALIYGATGTTNLTVIDVRTTSLALQSNGMLMVGIALLVIGFAFKVAAVPFHMWTPDVYDGAPTPVTAFMAAAVKAAGFAALMRIMVHALGDSIAAWQNAVWWLAVITMLGGNLMALAQRHLKRMLAYSSIGHAGYLLTAVVSGTETGAAAYLFYAFAYTLVTLGAFGVLAAVGRNGERDLRIDDMAGLAAKQPWMAFAMAVFMLSLLGFPGTAGFMAKWYVLMSAIQADQWTLSILLVLASVVSAGYYLPVIMEMYMKPPLTEEAHRQSVAVGAGRWVIGSATALLLLFGFFPGRLMDLSRASSEDLKPSAAFTLNAPTVVDDDISR